MPSMEFTERKLSVSAGDTLFVYTDGLTDRRNAAGDFYSIDRIALLLEESRDAGVDAIYDRVYDDISGFDATDEYKDDIAFVITRFH
jgi:sigma-B regulation protein RsbU (phosphoserine phosphatase)